MAAYEPTPASIATHQIPDWFRDAKLGIFIHWGAYAVPAWAPDEEAGNPYAEWYPRHMYEPGTPTYEYHRETYGEAVEYVDFLDRWSAEAWEPDAWADFFADVGARYVVLTGEHHDGIPLWPSHYTRYTAADRGPERDIVGELSAAVRNRDLRFAASYHANLNYYQPGFEGAFGHPDWSGKRVHSSSVDIEYDSEFGPGSEYVAFMEAKHRELIRRYEPDLLWFDTPQAPADHLRSRELIADYYNRAETWGKPVAVNDRSSLEASTLAGRSGDDDGAFEGDFATPEYRTFETARPFVWETCRGIGDSFGYNRREGPADHLGGDELVRLLVDVVAKNGNLLLNIGPRADGTIPELQRRPLEELGDWLDECGEAIFGTRPWTTAAETADGVEARYTRRDGDVFAIVLGRPSEPIELGAVRGSAVDRAEPLGGAAIDVQVGGSTVDLSIAGEAAPAYAVALRGAAGDA